MEKFFEKRKEKCVCLWWVLDLLDPFGKFKPDEFEKRKKIWERITI